MLNAFLVALQFLTRIPVTRPFAGDERMLGHSILFYPVVGLLLGLILLSLAAILAGSSAPVVAALVLTTWVLLTGGLHLDGLADCADAWVGGFGNPPRSLQIMKDPTSGPIAVAVLVLVLLLKWSALMALLDHQTLLPLLFAPLLGRSAILLLMLSTPYVSPQGLAEKLLRHLPMDQARWVAGVSLTIAVAGLGWASVLIAGLLLLAIRRAALARLGGVTGDVYGAAVELSETAALLAVAI